MTHSIFELERYARYGLPAPSMTPYDRLRAQALFTGSKTETLTGIPPIIFRSDGTPLTAWSIYGNGQQTGTPTPDNPIMPTFCGKLVESDWTIPITCAGQTVSVCLGQTQTVRRVKKLVLTGYENWETQPNVYINNTALFAVRQDQTQIGKMTNRQSINTHFISTAPGVNPQRQDYVCSGYHPADGYSDYYYIRPDFSTIGITSETTGAAAIVAFETWLRQQYAAGTPVTVWCVLATPETAIVNEPIAKIGNYADELHSEDAGVTIPTTRGQNVLTVDTDLQPSSVTISGHITGDS